MLNLQRVTMFIAVVDAGSFTLAAAALGQTKAVVSFNVRQLENELGVTLLLRSTRRLRLTDAGVLFYQRGVALLNAAENLQDEVRASHSGLSGELRITTTPEYGAIRCRRCPIWRKLSGLFTSACRRRCAGSCARITRQRWISR